MISIWNWLADIILAVLLIATLVMAIRLDRALRVVRRDRAVFEALISNLGSATNSVKLGIQALRNEADRAAEQIERRTEDADKLATDLSFLIDAADRAGARLEEGRLAAPAAKQPVSPEIDETELPAAPVVSAPALVAPVQVSPIQVAPVKVAAKKPDPVVVAAPPAVADEDGGLRQLAGLGRRRRTRGTAVLATNLSEVPVERLEAQGGR